MEIEVINMESVRDVDIMVFGATGFTGKRVVAYAVKAIVNNALKVQLGVAGRNSRRLSESLDFVRDELRKENVDSSAVDSLLSSVTICVADVSDDTQIENMCKRSRVLLNCVGPYSLYGEPVVAACVKYGTDYTDITGEPLFIETIMLKYDKQAVENDCLIVPSAGFDSVPADVGASFCVDQFSEQGALCVSVEEYINLKSQGSFKGHYATYESAVRGFGNVPLLAKVRKEARKARIQFKGPSLRKGSVFFHKDEGKYAVKFPGSDASVVRCSQQFINDNRAQHPSLPQPVQFGAYFTITSRLYIAIMAFFGIIFAFLAKFSFGRNILLAHPKLFTMGVFSHEGPSEEELKGASFSTSFYGLGYKDPAKVEQNPKARPDLKIVARFAGPEPGYVATPIFVTECAFSLLFEKKSTLPFRGVVPPAIALRDSEYLNNLRRAGIVVEKVRQENL